MWKKITHKVFFSSEELYSLAGVHTENASVATISVASPQMRPSVTTRNQIAADGIASSSQHYFSQQQRQTLWRIISLG